MPKTRTFIAVEALDEVHARALQAIDQLRTAVDNVKWVAQDNLHWTLQFLGDLTDSEMAEVCRKVGRVAAELAPFLLAAEGVGAFPSNDRPRTLWLGAGQGGEALCQLQDDIEKGLADMGFRGERRQYVPHLTLGRVGRGSHGSTELTQRMSQLADFEGGQMVVEEVAVFASELTREGPIYTALAHAPLESRG